MRDFARSIGEDTTDVLRWKRGQRKINARAVIGIVRLHPEILAFELCPEIFPKDLDLVFRKPKI
jgi:DNA-binding transcriptional regulator YdaS (Cro superfamily)